VKGGFWHRLDLWARLSFPVAMTFVLAILGAIPLGAPGLPSITPWYTLIAVYYWTIHLPDLMPPVAVFAIGVFQDLILGWPVGLSAVVLLLLKWALMSQRRFLAAMPFLLGWLSFGLVALGTYMIAWMLVSIAKGTTFGPLPILFACLMTIGCFPILSGSFAQAQRAFLRLA
jgi:rod shape-determining protein MreD